MSDTIKALDTNVTFLNDQIKGDATDHLTRNLSALKGIFQNEEAFDAMDQDQLAYEVDTFFPVPEGEEGGLFFGLTRLFPGKIGDEYIMTKGHFHTKSDRAEFYWGIEGEGVLLLMDRSRTVTAQKVYKGSLNYVPAHIAHRMVNTGSEVLSFGACWPSDSGHDYKEIADNGFAAKVVEVNGEAQIIKTK